MALIDGGQLKKELDKWAVSFSDPRCYVIGDAKVVIDNIPTIDAVPVTRCRDCAKLRVEQIGGKAIYRCPMFVYDLDPDFYCAEGVEKEAKHDSMQKL